MSAEVAERVGEDVKAKRLAHARSCVYEIERFAYRELSEAEGAEAEAEARRLMAIVVGLRRKLDAWRNHGAA